MNREKVGKEHRIFRALWWVVNLLLLAALLCTIVTGKDRGANLLTRRELQDPAIFREATSLIPNYVQDYNYESFSHVRVAAVPLRGFYIRRQLDRFFPGWDEYLDWSLLLERRSFLFFFLTVNALLALLMLRVIFALLADHHFRVPRFRLRHHLSRAIAAFFSTPEIK
jgi:hypothetical protein